jgi:hypothetical protein
MVASGVFITDVQGKHIISRNYRGDVPITKAVEVFAKYLTDIPEEQKKPIFYHDSGEFMMEEEAGATGITGETFVYVSVRVSGSSSSRSGGVRALLCLYNEQKRKWKSISPFNLFLYVDFLVCLSLSLFPPLHTGAGFQSLPVCRNHT